jgi:signal transduction histidine kinase
MTTAADFATLPRALAIAVVFNTLIAGGIAITRRHGFGDALVYSQCIGLTILVLVDVTRRILWGRGIPPQAGILALSISGIVLGFLLGTTLASLLVGRPIEASFSGSGFLTGVTITFFAGIAGCWYFMNRERVAHLRLNAETIERGAVEARLKLLHSQIEPHFLFNTLANLHSLIAADPPRAQKMLEHLNDYLRATLDAARRDSGTLGEEFALLRGYLEVLAIRMGQRLSFTLSLPQDLAESRIPPMLLQPLVENAVKHGLEPKIDGGRLDVSASSSGGYLVIEVADTGLGVGSSAVSGTGIGVQNVKARLAGAFGGSSSFDLAANASGGTTATIRIKQ